MTLRDITTVHAPQPSVDYVSKVREFLVRMADVYHAQQEILESAVERFDGFVRFAPRVSESYFCEYVAQNKEAIRNRQRAAITNLNVGPVLPSDTSLVSLYDEAPGDVKEAFWKGLEDLANFTKITTLPELQQRLQRMTRDIKRISHLVRDNLQTLWEEVDEVSERLGEFGG
jgi:hypothetical protein